MILEVRAVCHMPSKFPEAAALGGMCLHVEHGRSFREVKARMIVHYANRHESESK